MLREWDRVRNALTDSVSAMAEAMNRGLSPVNAVATTFNELLAPLTRLRDLLTQTGFGELGVGGAAGGVGGGAVLDQMRRQQLPQPGLTQPRQMR